MDIARFVFEKRGRKYFKVRYENGETLYDLIINDVVESCEVGQTYTLQVKKNVVKSGKFIKATFEAERIAPLMYENGQIVENKELIAAFVKSEQYMRYMEEHLLTDKWYEKGEVVLKKNIEFLTSCEVKIDDLLFHFEDIMSEKEKVAIKNIEKSLKSLRKAINTKNHWIPQSIKKIERYINILNDTDVDTTSYINDLQELKTIYKEKQKG